MLRFIEATEKMKAALNESRIGDLEVVTFEQIPNVPFAHGTAPAPVPEWWFDPQKTGGEVLLETISFKILFL